MNDAGYAIFAVPQIYIREFYDINTHAYFPVVFYFIFIYFLLLYGFLPCKNKKLNKHCLKKICAKNKNIFTVIAGTNPRDLVSDRNYNR